MSAAIEQRSQITNLPAPSSFTSLAKRDKLTTIESEVIASLPNQTPEELLETRKNAKLLSETAWRIECAVDYQTIASAEDARRGRGKWDEEGKGITSAVRKRAKLLNVTPNTIFMNASVHRLIADLENRNPENKTLLRLLDEKSFFLVAIKRAADPAAAVIRFASVKLLGGRFRPSDAHRLLEREGLTKKIVLLKAINKARESIPALQVRRVELEHIQKTLTHVKNHVVPTCTNPDITRIHQSYAEELEEYMKEQMFDDDAAYALRLAWDEGCLREDQLSERTGFPADVVHREMGLLAADGEFIKVSGSGTSQRWHRVGKPLPPELRIRRA